MIAYRRVQHKPFLIEMGEHAKILTSKKGGMHMKFERKTRSNHLGLNIIVGIIIAISIMGTIYNVILPMIVISNPEYFEPYHRLFPESIVPALSVLLIGVFLYHITRFVMTSLKK